MPKKKKNIKQNVQNIIRTDYEHNKLNSTVEQNDFTINETY